VTRNSVANACLLVVLGLIAPAGCRNPPYTVGVERSDWTWPGTKPKSAAPAPPIRRPLITNYEIVMFRSTGDDACLEQVWSYLDELLPGSRQQWQMLIRNGLRCGLGQIGDSQALTAQLERCQTRLDRKSEMSLTAFAPIVLHTDPMRPERILFYYDQNGRASGRTLGPSALQLVLTSAGRTGTGRMRVILTPRIVQPESSTFEMLRPETPPGKYKTIEEEIEGLSIVVDIAPNEFALIGPASGSVSTHLLGAQLFLHWDQGQQQKIFILIRPQITEPTPPPAEEKT